MMGQLLKILSPYVIVIVILVNLEVHCSNHQLLIKIKKPTQSSMSTKKHNYNPMEEETFKLDHIPGRFSRPPDGNRDTTREVNYLPTGPAPYRPASLLLAVNHQLEKFHFPTIKWRMQKRKIYYTYLDVIRLFHRLAEQISSGQIKVTGAKLHLFQSMIGKIASIGGKSLKLKWPLVMLNPNFLKELLANPTFLVMLFHAIEVGYMSSPWMNLLLGPLINLIKQPSPEKEERSWWRRKRLYETFNGIGSSELQPNLKTIHFRQPGKPIQASFPGLSDLFPNFYNKDLLGPPKYQQPNENHHHQATNEYDDWQMANEQQLLSQDEFEALDENEKDRVYREAKQNLEESLWTNELIRQQNSFVESLQNKLDASGPDKNDDLLYQHQLEADGQGPTLKYHTYRD